MSIHSDWGDWLPKEIEAASPDGVAIWYLGCNGFVLKGSEGTTILIDPYLGTGKPPRTIRMIPVPFHPDDIAEADAVLASHEHSDHVDGPSQAPILANTGATFYGADDSVEMALDEQDWLANFDVTEDQFDTVEEGDTVEIGEFTVHVEHAHDPDATHPISYVIEHEAGTFFHGGDSKPADEFADIGERYDIDLGVLAFGTVAPIPSAGNGELKRTRWYNDENQIIECAEDLQLDRLLPSHWDMWKRLTADPKALHHHARGFEYPANLDIVEIGDRVDL